MIETLLDLAGFFGLLSMMSVGGGNAVIPDIQRYSVLVRQWVTETEFTAIYAIAQAAPGPSSMIVALIGYKASGWAGAFTATLAMYLPSSLMTFAAVQFLDRFQNSSWRKIFEQGVAPVAVGLIFASAYLVGKSMNQGTGTFIIITGTAILHWKTRMNPIVTLLAGGILGAMGWAS
jgi:chromate transporter